jgi:hypothetical protein
MPISQISLPVTFLTRENFRTENIQFEVVDFETMYNAFLGRPTLTKFMVIPHYAYLVLKMLGPHGVISIRGYVQRAYDYDKESLAESPPPLDLIILDSKASKTSVQLEDALGKQVPLSTEESSEVAHIGNTLDPK